jgi:Immunoglobulin-like domain of bacterial spore germination/Sporulation and spore germination
MNRRAFLLAGAVLLALAGAACGRGDSGSLGTVPTGTAPPPPSASPSPSPAPGRTSPVPTAPVPTASAAAPDTRTITVAVWFTRDGALAPTSRTRPVTLATSRLALTELAAGPTTAEAAAGVGTAVPDVSFDVGIADGVATVDFPEPFYAGGRDTVRLRQGQVVYTLTQFPTVSEVAFRAGGEPVGEPAGRAAYADLLPAIVVTDPIIGARVTSPVTVAGTANVFEATVSIRILDASGAEIATRFTTATCGTGCRGDYSAALPYRLADEQPGTVQVFEVSAVDGSRINVVDIPVTLAPSR